MGYWKWWWNNNKDGFKSLVEYFFIGLLLIVTILIIYGFIRFVDFLTTLLDNKDIAVSIGLIIFVIGCIILWGSWSYIEYKKSQKSCKKE
jgi:hypothetical protein